MLPSELAQGIGRGLVLEELPELSQPLPLALCTQPLQCPPSSHNHITYAGGKGFPGVAYPVFSRHELL